jgi:hypothetical protein
VGVARQVRDGRPDIDVKGFDVHAPPQGAAYERVAIPRVNRVLVVHVMRSLGYERRLHARQAPQRLRHHPCVRLGFRRPAIEVRQRGQADRRLHVGVPLAIALGHRIERADLLPQIDVGPRLPERRSQQRRVGREGEHARTREDPLHGAQPQPAAHARLARPGSACASARTRARSAGSRTIAAPPP